MKLFKMAESKNDTVTLIPVDGGDDMGEIAFLHRTVGEKHTCKKEEFLAWLESLIDKKDIVQSFYLLDDKIRLYMHGIENDHYIDEEIIIYFRGILTLDKSFASKLVALSNKYMGVDIETHATINDRLKKHEDIINRDKKIRSTTREIAHEFSSTGTIESDLSDYVARSIRDELVRNEGEFYDFVKIPGKDLKSKIVNLLNIFWKTLPLHCISYIALAFFFMNEGLEVCSFYLSAIYAPNFLTICGLELFGTLDRSISSCKSEVVQELVSFLEKEYDMNATIAPSKTLEEKFSMEGNFLTCVKKLYNFMRLDQIEFENELVGLNEMLTAYILNKIHHKFDKFYFMNWLMQFEAKVFEAHRNSDVKPIYDVTDLEDRLAYLGFDFRDDMSSSFVSDVFDEIHRICNLPYDGCNLDIIRLSSLAIEHCETLKDEDDNYFARGIGAGKSYEALSKIQTCVSKKIDKRYGLDDEGDAVSEEKRLEEEKGFVI